MTPPSSFSSLRKPGRSSVVGRTTKGDAGLTTRQLECLRLASQGCSSHDIAIKLSLSPRTVQEHFMNACARLKVATTVQAIARLVAEGRLDHLQVSGGRITVANIRVEPTASGSFNQDI